MKSIPGASGVVTKRPHNVAAVSLLNPINSYVSWLWRSVAISISSVCWLMELATKLPEDTLLDEERDRQELVEPEDIVQTKTFLFGQ